MKKITALILYSFLTTMALRADVIYQETFSYSNGLSTVTSTNVFAGSVVTNWLLHSGTADSFINNHRLEVSSSSAYLGVTATRSGDVYRPFSNTNNCVYTNSQQVLYASFIVNFTNLPTAAGAYFAHFKYNATGFSGRLWALTNGSVLPNTFRLAVSAGTAATPSKIFPVDLALNTDYQVVLGFDPVTLDALSLWINPVSSGDASVTSNDPYAPGANIANSFAFRQATGFGGFLTASNLVVATTFAEAATNVTATNAIAPKIVYQPVGTTNYPGAPVTLAAVANGQGLGNMTYQWQQNGGNYAGGGSGGTSSMLTISSSVVGDSGDYTLIATTPYGLSVTSSVAKVKVLTDTQVPPSFTTQPASQTAYRGQTVTFTAHVITPGNPTFTWYSNNVVITDGVTSPDAYSSALQFNNIATNLSGSIFKVAVTNDTFSTGIVSTNAVLTVLNPAGVTIAFLRSLVDPSNFYQPTNTTQPFQVTGVVTTYTNLTSGNTLSYYLQDGTAGINIFATFGSTFRPAQGDVVTFVGVLSSFSSGLELAADTVNNPSTSYSIVSNNFPLPAPMSIPFTITNSASGGYANMNTNIAGRLVQLSNVFFGTNSGTTITNGFVTVTNNLGQPFNLWFSAVDLDVLGQTFPSFASTVTGVMFGGMNPVSGVANPTFAVGVTKFSDIVAAVPTYSDVSVVKTGPSYVFARSNLTYSITVSNAGPDAATGVVATDTLATNMTFVSTTGGGVNSSGVVTWTLAGIPSGATSNVTVTVKAPASGSLTNKAGVSASSMDPNAANNTSANVITSVAPLPVAGPIAVSGGNATISWNVAAGPTYSVLWSTNVAGPYSIIASGLTTSPYTDTAHTTKTMGFYKITSP